MSTQQLLSRRQLTRYLLGSGASLTSFGRIAQCLGLERANQIPTRYVLQRWLVNTMQAQLYRPSKQLVLLAAHRGLWRDTPENSETGIRNSFAQWEMIETDLRKTKDYRVLNQLVVTHDPNISRTTTGLGNLWTLSLEEVQRCKLLDRYGSVYGGGNWYPGDANGSPMNDRETGVGQKVLTITDLFRIHQDFLTGTDAEPMGPLIVMDVKGAVMGDPEFTQPARGAFNTIRTAVTRVQKLPIRQRKALIFMVKFNLFTNDKAPVDARAYLEQNVPAYRDYDARTNPLPRLMLVFNPEDGTKDPPNDRNFQSLLSAPYLSHFEMNQYYLGDGCQVYIDYLVSRGQGISTYSENAFAPEGVWDVTRFFIRNQDFNVVPIDEREIPDHTIANSGVGLVVSERPAETDAFLRQYNLRNVPVG